MCEWGDRLLLYYRLYLTNQALKSRGVQSSNLCDNAPTNPHN